jgi:hypothetical protein
VQADVPTALVQYAGDEAIKRRTRRRNRANRMPHLFVQTLRRNVINIIVKMHKFAYEPRNWTLSCNKITATSWNAMNNVSKSKGIFIPALNQLSTTPWRRGGSECIDHVIFALALVAGELSVWSRCRWWTQNSLGRRLGGLLSQFAWTSKPAPSSPSLVAVPTALPRISVESLSINNNINCHKTDIQSSSSFIKHIGEMDARQ